jgi:Heavy metal associated domain 2
MTAQAHVTSHTPGRVRLRVRRGDRAQMARLQAALVDRPGVAAVHMNQATGSVLVHYNHNDLSRGDVMGILADVGVIVRDLADLPELPDGGPSSTAGGLIDAVADLDKRLSDLTGRRFDLKLLFPLALGAIGLRQTLAQGHGLSQLPGYVLLWYAFDSFWKFHQQSLRPGAPPDGASGNGTAP